MEEKRKFNRWYTQNKATISYEGVKNEVSLLDVSAGGMRFFSDQPLEIGSLIYGEFKVLSQLNPFFVKGRVIRTQQKDSNRWEIAVRFEKVSTLPFIS